MELREAREPRLVSRAPWAARAGPRPARTARAKVETPLLRVLVAMRVALAQTAAAAVPLVLPALQVVAPAAIQ